VYDLWLGAALRLTSDSGAHATGRVEAKEAQAFGAPVKCVLPADVASVGRDGPSRRYTS
jgi:hypothetical protein